MSCLNDCTRELKFACLSCEILLCSRHSKRHKKKSNHFIQEADEKIKSIINQKYLKYEKCKRINQITLDTCELITNLQELSQKKINLIKDAKVLEDLRDVRFGIQNHLLDLAVHIMVNQNLHFISNSEIATELTSIRDKRIAEIADLKGIIMILQEENYQMKRDFDIVNSQLRDIDYIRKVFKELQDEENIKYNQGIYLEGFNNFQMKQKMEYIKRHWNFITADMRTKELLLSKDGKYIFECNF